MAGVMFQLNPRFKEVMDLKQVSLNPKYTVAVSGGNVTWKLE